MKKTETQKTTDSTLAAANHFGGPMPPVAGSITTGVGRWADPSSAERSNRYPVPTQEYRPR